MEKQAKQRLKPKQLAAGKKPEEDPVLSKTVDNKKDIVSKSNDNKKDIDKAKSTDNKKDIDKEKSVDNKKDINKATDQPIVYDYMKYPSYKKKAKLSKCAKVQKCVSFKLMVELVTFTENWKMKMIEGKLRTEEEQVG